MSPTWESGTPPYLRRIGPLGWCIVALRVTGLLVVLVPGVLMTLLLRLIEGPLMGAHRPLTARIQKHAIWAGLRVIGLRYRTEGTPLRQHGAVVANHASWMDIFALGAGQRIVFVSKAEVQSWPGIGFLARLVGTVFITRNPREAADQQAQLERELTAGRKLLFFPEGTSTDGMRVLPFKSTLFAAFMNMETKAELAIQPVTVVYTAPLGLPEARFYGWWGDMDLEPHMAQVLAQVPQGDVKVIYHEPVQVAEFADRKALATELEARVRAGMPEDRRIAN
ncbi:MAG: lysophospholipid acyltransferase family protein [Pseudomonadota bacterium]